MACNTWSTTYTWVIQEKWIFKACKLQIVSEQLLKMKEGGKKGWWVLTSWMPSVPSNTGEAWQAHKWGLGLACVGWHRRTHSWAEITRAFRSDGMEKVVSVGCGHNPTYTTASTLPDQKATITAKSKCIYNLTNGIHKRLWDYFQQYIYTWTMLFSIERSETTKTGNYSGSSVITM